MDSLSPELQKDIDTIGRIPIIDTILEVICRTTGMGFAAVARVTENRWIACRVKDDISFGLKPGGELKVETTICDEIRQSGNGVIIDHVSEDAHFVNHHTPAMYGFQSYISIPIIRKDGSFFGTLCSIDPRPAQLNNPQVIGMFNLFADLISFHIQSAERLADNEAEIKEQKHDAELREQFIAILGHDLRNPLSAIQMSAELLSQKELDKDATKMSLLIKRSADRIASLADNLLDFTSGHLGSGITLKRENILTLDKVLFHIIAELESVSNDHSIHVDIQLNDPVHCDSNRIAQLFSNLLGNALAYGSKDQPVEVYARSENGAFELSVTNYGEPIPANVMADIFKPFYRGGDKSGKNGLGLGLYISAEIAKAHGGTLEVKSDTDNTRFTLRF